MSLPVFFVDAFTNTPFAGNAAAVVVLDGPREDAWLLRVASEMNQAATAFIYPQDNGYNLRWFSAKVELELCGHGTLASAHTLWGQGYLASDAQARFHTRAGLLTANKVGEWIELNFPAKPEEQAEILPIFAESLGATPLYIGKSQLDYIARLESEAVVRGLQPDFARLVTIPARGIIVTAQADANHDYDFVSRFFCPSVGINEDPVTGSAHCALSPFWSKQLGRDQLTGYQASARGGVVRVRLDGERVHLGGQALTTLRGELLS
ncbi:PhzF family phenazine biosynthesis protein [Ktedonobacter racemifer]|uniref:Phenazine biosynthesis protein PhzF family n=1 Tax=Ktedonobacter racemifer DSM 44963 TaxID=485913 RepID=D6TVN6_KTERA|nr:PhzF family phenazine biosynthesis protein [Ktedonobacter racemifer]EFH84269.1 phenazine biosynthesis protein PhzF family [Ktedonobacter racemifer DSM 44963]